MERRAAAQESRKKSKCTRTYTTKARHLTSDQQINLAEDAERAKLLAAMHKEFKGTVAKHRRAQSTANTKEEAQEYFDIHLDKFTTLLQREPSLTGPAAIAVFEAHTAGLKSILVRPFPTPAERAQAAARAAAAANAAALTPLVPLPQPSPSPMPLLLLQPLLLLLLLLALPMMPMNLTMTPMTTTHLMIPAIMMVIPMTTSNSPLTRPTPSFERLTQL
ncbi:hypothetical protein HGRIS_004756 [Hohenbuehelia grisea]|uniref:Uncharacterized protein n=1 Tax=Hohenbuehelia grisea TaxID=104357 RepID=A0ABR3JDG9_9AGAR